MDEFNFYNSENDGYRGGFGGYVDPEPGMSGTPYSTGPMQPRHKKGGAGKFIALVLACAIAGGGAGVGGAYLYNRMAASSSSTVIYEEDRPQVRTVLNTNNGQPMTPEQLYAANLASCVGITVNTTVNIFGQTTTSAASGSGFVLSQDGYIATNYHVIESAVNDSSVTIQVSFSNGSQYDARLVGGEKDNDVAVLKIEATGLTPVTLGDSSKLVVGEAVYAIGNPLGGNTLLVPTELLPAGQNLLGTFQLHLLFHDHAEMSLIPQNVVRHQLDMLQNHAFQNLHPDEVPTAFLPALLVQGAVEEILREIAVVGRTVLHLGAAAGAVDQPGKDTAPAGTGHAVPLLADYLDRLKYVIPDDALMGIREDRLILH